MKNICFWIIFSLCILTAAHILIIRKTYVCPTCGTKFRPKWYEISAWLHDGSLRVVKCPICHRRGFCPPCDKRR